MKCCAKCPYMIERIKHVTAQNIPSFSVGTVTTGTANVEIDPASTATNIILNFTLPSGGGGIDDLTATAITLPSGSPATATLTTS